MDYITLCRNFFAAKSLLTYSEKTLAEISNYLCFSNQSYFQNVFKNNLVSHRFNIGNRQKSNHDKVQAIPDQNVWHFFGS